MFTKLNGRNISVHSVTNTKSTDNSQLTMEKDGFSLMSHSVNGQVRNDIQSRHEANGFFSSDDASNKKIALISEARKLMDLVYPETDAKEDVSVQKFRDNVLRKLTQAENAQPTPTLIKQIEPFVNMLRSLLPNSNGLTV